MPGIRVGRRVARWQLRDHTLRAVIHEWSAAEPQRVAICVHGFLGSGREFEPLARRLAQAGWRVLCPDLPGYGESDWLPDPADYGGEVYRRVMQMASSIAAVPLIDLVGSSMGAALALRMAALHPAGVRRLVLNDSGVEATPEALLAVLERVPPTTWYRQRVDAEAAVARYRADCDPLPPADWARILDLAIEPADGGWRLRYDPNVVSKLVEASEQVRSQWPAWEAVRCPVLVIRGDRSDMLPAEVAERMIASKANARLMTVANCGHRSWLRRQAQVAEIVDWLSADDP